MLDNEGLHIRAFVAPFNVANSYDETMAPHAFDKFLEDFEEPLPMRAMHNERAEIGEWRKFWKTPEGLWAQGVVTDIAAIVAARSGELPELSISWGDGGEHPETDTIARGDFKRNYYGLTPPRRWKFVPEITEHRDVDLSEVSLVDRGAFPGTHWEEV